MRSPISDQSHACERSGTVEEAQGITMSSDHHWLIMINKCVQVTLMELLAALHDDDDNSENSGNGSGKLGTVVICCR